MAKILVVDDEPGIVSLLTDFLHKKNYEVVTASGGAEALEMVRLESPQIVLLDVRMPGMSGLEVLREIKKINKNVSVIIATAVADEDIGRTALEVGAFDYILKPIDLNHLEKVLWWKLKTV